MEGILKSLQEKSAQEVLLSLNSNPKGLTTVEVLKRTKIFGKNIIEINHNTSWYKRFISQFTHFFALILWAAAALGFYAHSQDPTQGLDHLASSIVLVVVINGIFGFWQEFRAEKLMKALKDLLPVKAKVRRSDNAAGSAEMIIEIPATEIVPGDIIILNEGDAVPADSRLIVSNDLRVSNATLTGESKPSLRTAEILELGPHDSVFDSHNLIFAGTNIHSGNGEALVFAIGKSTEFGKMANLTQKIEKTLSPLQTEINIISIRMMWISIFLAILCFVAGTLTGLSPWTNFIFALGILIANIPEGLLPTVTLALAVKTQKMAKRKALVRLLASVETLGCTTVICTDKTGTLTQNSLSAEVIYLNGNTIPKDNFKKDWSNFETGFFEVLLNCHSLKKNSEGKLTGDPLEIALVNMAELSLAPASDLKINYSNILSIPFDSDRRRMSVLQKKNNDFKILTKGASEVIIGLSTKVLWKEEITSLTSNIRENFEAQVLRLSNIGYRVLALATKDVQQNVLTESDETDLVLVGLIALHDPPRAEVPEAIMKCHKAHIRMVMITGDHPVTALAIARQIGMITSDNPRVITGTELAQLSETQLPMVFDNPDVLFARVTAQQKMLIVLALKKKGEIVAATGDGVNDAPALKAAHIGISMGISGTSVAKEAADVILVDDNFASIVNAIEEGRSVYDNIKKFLTYILTSNVPEIIPYLVSVFFLIPLPLTVPLILAVDLGTDLLPALALGADAASPEVMQLPPRKQSERLLNWKIFARAYFFLGPLEALPAVFLFILYIKNHGWHYGESLHSQNTIYMEATTLCFASIVCGQMLNVLLCQHASHSIFKTGIFKNRMIFSGLLFEVLLMLFIVFSPLGNEMFGTRSFELKYWILILPFLVFMLLAEEVRKLITRSKQSISLMVKLLN
jgi:calcium-translocating P-type ATPase